VVARQEKRDAEASGEWLEAQLRETKARLHKVEGELEQALKRVWALDADLRKLVETLNVSASAGAQVAGLREEVRQVRDQLGRVQDRQAALSNRTEELTRQRQAETGRERQDLGTIVKQVESIARGTDKYESRLGAIEEALRHVEEDVASTHLHEQALQKSLEEVSVKGARSYEAAVRLDQDVAKAAAILEELKKFDAVLDDRVNATLEQVRKMSERVDKVERFVDFPEEARELLQRANAEREQITLRIAMLERVTTDQDEKIDESLKQLKLLEQKGQMQGAQIIEAFAQLQEVSDQMRARLQRMVKVMLRQRRRQYESIAQEIKELSQGEPQGSE
jgi:chromosome segregation ATPase